MLSERNRLIKELKKELEHPLEFVSFMYRDGVEIEKGDLKKIEKFLTNIKSRRAILILHGIGGCSNTGRALAIMFRKQFNKGLWTAIPIQTSSALLYSVIISTGVIVSDESIITPLDPYFYYRGRYLRASIHLNDPDNNLRKKAIKHWEDNATFCIKTLSTPGSICVYPDRLNVDNLEVIVKKVLKPETHNTLITCEDLKNMGFEHVLCKQDDSFWRKLQEVTNNTLLELSKKNLRCIMDTSTKTLEIK